MAQTSEEFFRVREVMDVPGMPDWSAVRIEDGWYLAYYRPAVGESLRLLNSTDGGHPSAEALIAWWQTGGHDD